MEIRKWSLDEIKVLYATPLFELIYRAATVHRRFHNPQHLQLCQLISIKTGGCSEDCRYCPQSAHYQTDVTPSSLLNEETILAAAKEAVEKGATRFCMGAAWRGVRSGPHFERIKKVVKEISSMGIEVCCTLGLLNETQAQELKEAGLYAYNHNLDTSPNYYPKIITTRRFEDRLETLDAVQRAGINLCCGGIIGMGESEEDRLLLLSILTARTPHPESIPINFLIPVKGTPLENAPKVSIWEAIRLIATARIAMPKAMIRLSAGRLERSLEEQALCFLAGANAIFCGEKLLTCPNPGLEIDDEMMKLFNLTPKPAFEMGCA